MSVSESVILTKEMQRSNKLATYGSYQYSRITPLQGLGATISGGDVSEFEIPAKVINHNLDRLEFDLALPAGGAGVFNKMFADGIAPIRQLQYISRSNVSIVDVPFFNYYCNATFRQTNKISDVQTFERTVLTNDQFEGLSCCNVATNVRIPVTAGAMVVPNELYLEPLTIVQSVADTAFTIKFRINMGMLKDTFFGVSKDINFNEITTIRIIWDDSVHVGFGGTSATNTATNLAVLASYSISNLYYYVALEKNQSMINLVKDEPRQSLDIPYIWPTKIQGSAGNSVNSTLTLRYNVTNGSRLVRLYWAPYNNTQTATTVFDHDNLGGLKVASFYVNVDGEKTVPFDYALSTTDSTSYNCTKHLLKGSCIMSANDYAKYFTHIENFGDNYPLCSTFDYDKSHWKEGMPIEKEIKIDISYTNASANAVQSQNYIFAVCQRKLVIDRDAGIIVNSEP